MNLLTVLTLCILSSVQLTNEQQVAVLKEAQSAYDNGVSLQTADPVAAKESFRRSAQRFQILVDDGVENGKLLYNLGNANVQAGQIGEAIAAYRIASRYIPSDGRLRGNLAHTRSLVHNPFEKNKSKSLLTRLTFWHDSLPTGARLGLGMICWVAFWGLLSVHIFISIPGFKTASTFLGFFAIVLSVSVGVDIVDQDTKYGVIATDEVIVRKGNGTNYSPMLNEPIGEGVEFEIIEQRPDWIHILLPNGTKGWVEEEAALHV
ncbi:MAG: hypothetical protein HOC93_07530 [Phycisphaerae bacterium]|jgi:hypothetical protein|nr:hypothetical protein [Phycisphaerae bacterium]